MFIRRPSIGAATAWAPATPPEVDACKPAGAVSRPSLFRVAARFYKDRLKLGGP